MPARRATPAPRPTPTQRATPTRDVRAVSPSAFGVQIGSYPKRITAESEAFKLGTRLALPARVVHVDLGPKGIWFRVVVGEVKSLRAATALRDDLRKQGFETAEVDVIGDEKRIR